MIMITILYILTVVAACYTGYDYTVNKGVRSVKAIQYSFIAKMWLLLVTIFMILK